MDEWLGPLLLGVGLSVGLLLLGLFLYPTINQTQTQILGAPQAGRLIIQRDEQGRIVDVRQA